MTNTLYDGFFSRHEGSARVFMELPDGTAWSYARYLEDAARYARVLHDLGLRPGDRLAMQVAKTPEALVLYAASIRAGVVLLPLNTAYTAAEMAYFLGDATPKLVVCDPRSLRDLEPLAAANGGRALTLDAAGQGTLADLAAGADSDAPVAERGPDDLATFLYTSGTTGRSKGAMLSHENLLSNAQTLARLWQFTQADTLIHALPVFHVHGLFVATNTALIAGTRLLYQARFDLDQIFADLPRATALMGVPTFYTRLLDDARLTRDAVAGMRLFISGSAPLLNTTHAAFSARTGHAILERYGMTETGMITSNPYEGARRPGTVGLPLEGVEVRICDPSNGAELPQGDTGMIEVRGPNVFQGYWQMPEKTKAELRDNGFFITGDLGMVEPDGYLRIVGRSKDLIISGGYNIYPKEIEAVIDAQPGVLESAVIGVPHPDFGEGVVAAIVAEPGAHMDADAIAGALKTELASFKRPKALHVLETLPRNTMGKVQKNLLRDRFADSFK